MTAPPTTGWPTNGGNLYNQRYSPLKAINRANVAQLKGVWRTRLRGSGSQPQYSGFAAPLVDDGVAYVSTGANDVFALSIDTRRDPVAVVGERRSEHHLGVLRLEQQGRGAQRRQGVPGPARRPAGGARSQRPGKVAWSIQAERWQENFSITAAPLYVDGMVIIGFAGGDRGTRSRLKAYDAKDGRLIWTFYTIPGPGEPGHDTWPKDNDAWKYGGAAIWQTPAVDLELGLLYFSTGNAAPDYNGAFRAGDNLYAASMLAIELATGKYRWHFQQVHHDIWDYDAVNPVVLMDVRMGGRTRKAIVEVGKTGWAYILDRGNGEAAHRHRREAGAAGAAAGDGEDAAVPARRLHRAAVHRDRAGRTRARQRRPHLHAVRRQGSDACRARASGAAPAGRRARTIPCSSGCTCARRR